MRYRVKDTEFDTFEEVILWAWNTHKLDFTFEDKMTEEKKQEACKDLETFLTDGDMAS